MLHFHIDPHSGVPVYRQMVDQARYYVASGALKPGDQLPSIRELAQALTINPSTVVRVYSELEREDIIEMRHGKGAYVSAEGCRMTIAERDRALRPLARRLAVEAAQMRMAESHVLRVVKEELAELQSDVATDPPFKVAKLGR